MSKPDEIDEFKIDFVDSMKNELLDLDYARTEATKKAKEYYRNLLSHLRGIYHNLSARMKYVYLLEESRFEPINHFSLDIEDNDEDDDED